MKHIRSAALALTMILVVAALAACGMSNNPKATKEALETKGYEVESVIGDNDLEAQAQLDGMSDEMHITAGELVAMIAAVKGEDDAAEFIYIYYFKDSAVANRFWDSNQKELNDLKEEYKDFEDFELKKDGSVVYFSTKQAVKDCK